MTSVGRSLFCFHLQTVRFQEVLDVERQMHGEKPPKVILGKNKSAPLSLKRSVSQSCDPHMAFVTLELGSFEDTVGRVSLDNSGSQKGSRSSSFAYKISAKIPVDKVGLYRYPMDWNGERRPGSELDLLGWILVRVALTGGTKVVTIESPFVLKNDSDVDVMCEVRDHDGLSTYWRSLILNASSGDRKGFVPVPADIVPMIHRRSYLFSVVAISNEVTARHESDIPTCDRKLFTRLSPPRPYSSSSLSKGVTRIRNEALSIYCNSSAAQAVVYMNICSIRIGSFQVDGNGRAQNRSEPEVPEQRMMIFRAPVAIRNHLAFPIRIQLRTKVKAGSTGSVHEGGMSPDVEKPESWVDLGIINCGESVRWSGAAPSERIELRVRFEATDGVMRQFPTWSTSITIPAEGSSNVVPMPGKLPELVVLDNLGQQLSLSVALTEGNVLGDMKATSDGVREYSEKLPEAGRVFSLYVPYWIIDGTGLDLQYRSSSFVAGQVDTDIAATNNGRLESHDISRSLGLGELLDDSDLIYLPSRLSFEILMIGSEGSNRLFVRRRPSRTQTMKDMMSPWSDPIPLSKSEKSHHDTTVQPPIRLSTADPHGISSERLEPFALRSRILRAPDAFGGSLGTKLVHIVCRYAIVNELGRDIEVVCGSRSTNPTIVNADGRPRPFHVDDAGYIRFRPKEFGWPWSGRFQTRPSRGDVTLRLKHKLKGQRILVTIEFHDWKQEAGTCIIVFRPAVHAPYRLENNSIFPIQYRQMSSPFDADNTLPTSPSSSPDSVILPYHNAEFAWDEPLGRRSVVLHLADFGDMPEYMHHKLLGTFEIDRVAPGTVLRLARLNLDAHVLADGPTRVLRVTEREKNFLGGQDDEQFQKVEGQQLRVSSQITVKLTRGIGISIVDWSPQELVYVRIEDIIFERVEDGSSESGNLAVGFVGADNQ